MSFLDLNDKYRNLPRHMLNSLENGSPGQAYIISGDSVDELREFVHEWIKVFVCKERTPNGACNQCRFCHLIDSGNYSEQYILEPASKSRSILTDALKSFQNHFFLKSQDHMKKIGLIFEADRLQIQAQNAFLKTLEEPPADTLFILLTVRPDMLLNTIKSRCRLISLARNKVNYDEDLKETFQPLLASLRGADGAAKALEVLEKFKVAFSKLRKKAEDEINEGYPLSEFEENDPSLRKKHKERLIVLSEGRYRMYREQIISMMELWSAQLYMLKQGVPLEELSEPSWAATDVVTSVMSSDECLLLVDALKKDLQGNVNEDLALEHFFLQICQK
ncbi:MAG: hypothetical protein HRT88_01065 [Lentisphaeraceae bacterium]|nr:hypothetical protein [Lentisphaeraceae bacterium]